jgi:hypothetical protein
MHNHTSRTVRTLKLQEGTALVRTSALCKGEQCAVTHGSHSLLAHAIINGCTYHTPHSQGRCRTCVTVNW